MERELFPEDQTIEIGGWGVNDKEQKEESKMESRKEHREIHQQITQARLKLIKAFICQNLNSSHFDLYKYRYLSYEE